MKLTKLKIEDWRLAIHGLAAVTLAGCAGQGAAGLSPAVQPPFHSTAEGRQEARRTLLPSISNPQSEIGNLQPTMVFAFHYSPPLTNCYLESSTDLLHWTVRDDYWTSTNADGTTYWNLRSDKSNSREFYRIGGESIQ